MASKSPNPSICALSGNDALMHDIDPEIAKTKNYKLEEWLETIDPGNNTTMSASHGSMPLPREISFIENSDTMVISRHGQSPAVEEVEGVDSKCASQKFYINSAIVSAALPNWTKVHSSTKKDGDIATIELPWDHDPQAFMTLMNICHWRFKEVPETPSIEEFYGLAQLTTLYGCAGIFSPWLEKWFVALKKTAIGIKDGQICLEMATIGHTFSCPDVFIHGIRDFILYSTTPNCGGNPVAPNGMTLEDTRLHSNSKAAIISVRHDILTKILQNIRDRVDLLAERVQGSSDNGHLSKFCRCDSEGEVVHCEASIYGSTVSSLAKSKLFPVPDDVNNFTLHSIADVKRAIEHMRLITYPEAGIPPHACRHRRCGLGVNTNINVDKALVSACPDAMCKAAMDNSGDLSGAMEVHEAIGQLGE